MARANRASYKTCFVFRLDDHSRQESTYLNHDGEWKESGETKDMVKCFDKESAEVIRGVLDDHLNRHDGADFIDHQDVDVIAEETECDIVHELQLYPFVEAFVQDLRRAQI